MFKYKVVFLILIIIFLSPVNSNAETLQEQLDKGYVEWSDTPETLYLRANETYYIGISATKGGSGGDSWNKLRVDGDYYWYRHSGYSGNEGQKKYYKIVVGSNDIRIDIAHGTAGSNGEDGIRSSSFNERMGGSAGANAFNLGTNPTNGGNSTYRIWDYACAGGGGGGSGASVIRFNNSNSQVLAANGGDGVPGRIVIISPPTMNP